MRFAFGLLTISRTLPRVRELKRLIPYMRWRPISRTLTRGV